MLPPGIRQGEQPPYHRLDEYLFQEMCCDLFQVEEGIVSCCIYGIRGQSQKGVDLLAHRSDGGIEVGQCKRYPDFSAKHIADASDEFFANWEHWKTKRVKRFILFVSCPLDRTQQVDELSRQQERFNAVGIAYEAWHSRRITMKLGTYPNIVSRYLSPPEYWARYICGPVLQGGDAGNQASVIINETLSSQLVQLSDHVASATQSQLEQMRTVWRQGRRTEALQWVRGLRDDTLVWLAFPADLRARLLRFEASIDLEEKGNLPRVKQLSGEADALCTSVEGLRLKALIAYAEKGAAAAIQILEGEEDIDSLNLKAALLLEMNQYGDCSAVIERVMRRFIPNGETYRVRSLLHLCIGNLTQARLDSQEALNREPYWRSTQTAAALVHYYSAMSSPALPRGVPSWPEPVGWNLIRRDNESLRNLERATHLFALLGESAEVGEEERRRLQSWRLASMANHPRLQDEALEYCRSVLEHDPSNIYVLAWAVNRSMAVDLSKSLTVLEESIREGLANPLHIVTAVSYYLANGMGSRALDLLDQTERVFRFNDAEGMWMFWKSQSLAVDGRPEEALKVVELLKDDRYALLAKTTAIRARASKCDEWQSLVDHLERCYSDTGNGMFLLDCCKTKAQIEDWAYIADHSGELVESLGTADAVELAAVATFKAGRYAECLALLDKCQQCFTDSVLPGSLSRVKVECQHSLGILTGAASEAEKLARDDPTIPNLLTLAKTYFSLGDLKSITLVARGVESRSDAPPEVCLHMARLVQWDDTYLAAALWKKATAHPYLPDELVGEALALGYQLGLDTEANPLLQRALSLGDDGKGGIHKKSIEDLKAFIDQQRANVGRIDELYAHGRIPVHLVAETLNVTLAEVFRKRLHDNQQHLCAYDCPPLLCRYGGRPIGLELKAASQWRLHMDVTAVLLAAHLQILDKIEEAFRPIRIPAMLIPSLIVMRDKNTPHQPSRAMAHRRVLDLARQSRVRILRPVDYPEPESILAKEMGSEWVVGWECVRREDGYLVDFLPLTNRDLSGSPTALPEDAWKTLVSCKAVVESLRRFGPLSEDEYLRALRALGTEGHDRDIKVVPTQHKTLLLNTGIPECLAGVGLLEAVCERFDVVITEREVKRVEDSLRQYEAAQGLSSWVGSIVDRMSRGVKAGVYKVIPIGQPEESGRKDSELPLGLEGLYSLLRYDAQPGDIVWVEDRALTSYRYRDGGVPIVGIAEVLDSLLNAGKLSTKEYFNLLGELRAAKVLFIPVRASEIVHHLMESRIENGKVVETGQLVILRRYVASCLANGHLLQRPIESAANPGEIPFVLNLGREIVNAIASLWETADADLEASQARADWIMESLYLDNSAQASIIGLGVPSSNVELAAVGMAGLLLAGLNLGQKERGRRYCTRRQYFGWLEKRMLRNRFAADPSLLKAVAEALKKTISLSGESLDRNMDAVWKYLVQQFYEDLPEPLQKELSRDQEFIARIGIRIVPVVEIGGVKVEMNEFVRAASEAINGRSCTAKPLEPAEPEIAFEPDPDYPRSRIIVRAGNAQQFSLEDETLPLLSKYPAEREAVLRKNRQWFDCSAVEFDRVVAEIASLQDPQSRLEQAKQWRTASTTAYYEDLCEAIHRCHGLPRRDFGLPCAENLCWYFRLSPDTGSGEELLAVLNKAAEELLEECGLVNALGRLCALPVPLPSTLVERVRRLSGSERRQLVRALLRMTGSPLSRIHLLRILTLCGEKSYLRLAHRIMLRMSADAGSSEFDAFKAVLEWAGGESSTWSISGLKSHIRLAMVWAHAHFVYTAAIGAGAPVSWISEVFGSLVCGLPVDAFRHDSKYWFDVSHPHHVNYTSFLLSGLAYALGESADCLTSPRVSERLVTMACVPTDERPWPSPSMLRDVTRYQDGLCSILGGDRGQTLRLLLGEDKSELLSSKSIRSILDLALRTLAADRSKAVAWAIVLSILSGSTPYDDVVSGLVDLLKSTDYTALYKRDAECGMIALRAASRQMASVQNEELRVHLIRQIKELAEWCNHLGRQAPGVAEPGSSRGVEMDLLECAFYVCLGQGTDEKVVDSFAEVVSLIMYAWPKSRREYMSTIESLCQWLPVSASKPMWKLLNLARSF